MKHVLRALAATLTAALVAGAFATAAEAAEAAAKREFVVAYKAGALKGAKHAVRAHDGKVLRTNKAGRLLLVRAGEGFAAAARKSKAIRLVVRNRRIGETGPKPKPVEQDGRGAAGAGTTVTQAAAPTAEPLADWQWDMRMIGATPDGTYGTQPGSKGVTVAVIDTGIDGSHPDIAPNFDAARSRNWTTDRADIDGPCDTEIDGSCASDPANVDEDGHGTHVAGEIAAPLNGFGMAGVAPNVTLVNDRAGQDSGFFFLFETVNALDYAGQIGADVANMSFYTDPWQFNCDPAHPALTPAGQPADTPEEVAQQVQMRALIQEAVNRAVANKVTLVAAAGNFHSDLDGTKTDDTSPDYPEGTEHVRVVSDWCRDMPNEADGVISVSSVGPSKAKADYSNYGAGQETGGPGDDPAGEIDVAAPGGYFRDFFGTPQFQQPVNEILGPYPRNVADANDDISGSGKPKSPFVVRDCTSPTTSNAKPAPQPKPKNECAYYQLIQGTSMASPHAAGVAALIVSQFGTPDAAHGGLTMDPAAVREKLRSSASNTPCPNPPTVSYVNVGRPASWTATCVGTPEYNGFYGDGIVSAVDAIKP